MPASRSGFCARGGSKSAAGCATRHSPRSNQPSLQQTTIDFKTVKSPERGTRHGASRQNSGSGKTEKFLVKEEKLRELRMPLDVLRVLPSVKKFQEMKKRGRSEDKIEIKDEDEDDDIIIPSAAILGVKRRRGESNKYTLELICEEKFNGMIFDVAFYPGDEGDLIVSCGAGAIICDAQLHRKGVLNHKLKTPTGQDKVITLPGAVGFLSDGKIACICRQHDTLNLFQPSGTFIKSFLCGGGAMGMAINSKDQFVITDVKAKVIRVYNTSGQVLHTVPTDAPGLPLQWPMFVSVDSEDNIYCSDAHRQHVLVFGPKGQYLQQFNMTTINGNELLRPHGLSINDQDDMFLVDTAVDSVEVFHRNGTFLQTLLTPEDGVTVKPKMVKVSRDERLVIGTMSGLVKLYEFTNAPSSDGDDIPAEVIVLDD